MVFIEDLDFLQIAVETTRSYVGVGTQIYYVLETTIINYWLSVTVTSIQNYSRVALGESYLYFIKE